MAKHALFIRIHVDAFHICSCASVSDVTYERSVRSGGGGRGSVVLFPDEFVLLRPALGVYICE